jgi:hypothetical protein
MKTLEEHIKVLPLQIRLKLLENTRKNVLYPLGLKKARNEKSSNLHSCIYGAFILNSSREGTAFWYSVIDKYNIP